MITYYYDISCINYFKLKIYFFGRYNKLVFSFAFKPLKFQYLLWLLIWCFYKVLRTGFEGDKCLNIANFKHYYIMDENLVCSFIRGCLIYKVNIMYKGANLITQLTWSSPSYKNKLRPTSLQHMTCFSKPKYFFAAARLFEVLESMRVRFGSMRIFMCSRIFHLGFGVTQIFNKKNILEILGRVLTPQTIEGDQDQEMPWTL